MFEQIKELILTLYHDKRIRFLFVGGLNTVIGYGFYALFVYLGFHYIAAQALSYVLGTINSYLWNKYFTFQSSGGGLSEILRFVSVYIVSFLCSSTTLFIFVSLLGLNKYVAGLVNIAVSTLISWFGHNYFSFKKAKNK